MDIFADFAETGIKTQITLTLNTRRNKHVKWNQNQRRMQDRLGFPNQQPRQGNQQQDQRQGYLPSKTGNPQDTRERKAPMNAMPVDRVPQQQYKPRVNACDNTEEFDYMNHLVYDGDEDSSLN